MVKYLNDHGYNLTVVGLPKTIDNDVYPLQQTLGAWTAAEQGAIELIDRENKSVTWRIAVLQSGSILDSEGIDPTFTIVTHEIISVEVFALDPIQESVYSFATLVGCFAFLLFLPLLVYFSARRKQAIEEQMRINAPEPEQ